MDNTNSIVERKKLIDDLLLNFNINSIYDDEQSSNKFQNFQELIEQTKARLKYIKSGATGHTFRMELRDPP